jgi:hypothetical protein
MERLNIVPMFQPAYSPQFNCIERVWGFMKHHFKIELAMAGWNVKSQDEFHAMLRRCEERVTVDRMVQAAYYNNLKYLEQVLKQGPEDDDRFKPLNVSLASEE